MSGICSAHQGHDENCRLCNTPGFSEKDIKEIYAKQRREDDERCSALCIHCRSSLVASWNRRKIFGVPRHSYDFETKIGYHDDCRESYEEWFKGWVNMWAAIGWHAKVDLR